MKLSLFVNYMILYIEKLRDFIKKLIELLSKHSILAWYKINKQKSVFLYYNSEQPEK
jgi:hypothetical protein